MNKYFPLLILAGVAGLFLLRNRIGKTIEQIKAIPKGIKFGKFNLFNGVDYDATIAILNGTPVELKINSFIGSVLYNGRRITDVSTFSSVTIPPQSSSDMIFSGKIIPLYLVDDIVDVIKNKDFRGKFSLEGMAATPAGRIPINVNLT